MIGILIFLPLTSPFASFLEKRFRKGNGRASKFIQKTIPDVAEAAIAALTNEVNSLIRDVIALNLSTLGIKTDHYPNLSKKKISWISRSYNRHYHALKQREGEILEFYGQIQKQGIEEEESARLQNLIQAVRNALHAAKNIKDITYNIKNFDSSANTELIRLHYRITELTREFYDSLIRTIDSDQESSYFEELANRMLDNQKNHDTFLHEVHLNLNPRKISETKISSLLNVNREIYSSNRALIIASKDLLLPKPQSDEFNNLPIYR